MTVNQPGEANINAKMTEEGVRRMRLLATGGMSSRKLGKMYGISQTAACKIISRATWGHVT